MLMSVFVIWMLVCPSTMVEEEYLYRPGRSHRVAKRIGDERVFGHLDGDGNFTEKSRRRINTRWGDTRPFHSLYQGGEAPTKVYEYRVGGVLVPGTVTCDTEFVATPSAATVQFKDYRYFPGATPIWNLPGYFYRKSDLNRPLPKINDSNYISELRKLPWLVEEYP